MEFWDMLLHDLGVAYIIEPVRQLTGMARQRYQPGTRMV
jgi:hypothetical protein